MFLQAGDGAAEIPSTLPCHCLLMTLHTKWLLESCLPPPSPSSAHPPPFTLTPICCPAPFLRTSSRQNTLMEHDKHPIPIHLSFRLRKDRTPFTAQPCWWGVIKEEWVSGFVYETAHSFFFLFRKSFYLLLKRDVAISGSHCTITDQQHVHSAIFIAIYWKKKTNKYVEKNFGWF